MFFVVLSITHVYNRRELISGFDFIIMHKEGGKGQIVKPQSKPWEIK
jgi:hypothetical protein